MPTILVVDDRLDFTIYVQDVLEDAGHRVVTALTGQEGLDCLRRESPDLIISDLQMPGMDGVGLLRKAKAILPGVPVVIVTGQDSTTAAVECMKTGAADFLLKPCSEEKLLAVVADCLNPAQDMEATVMPSHPELRRLHDYEIKQRLGIGTFGTVYLAEKRVDGLLQRVALKVLRIDILNGALETEAMARFRREAEVATSVRHPNIVAILEYDVSPEAVTPFLAMEYLAGVPLDKLDTRTLNWREKCEIMRQMTDALAELHSRQIVHRDVKPGNIMIAEDLHATLMDFGVVGLHDSDLTSTENTVGTPMYMAPETFTTSHVGPVADLFSLGIVGYELFTGKHPFDAEGIAGVADAIRFRPYTPMRQWVPDLPEELDTVIARMLAKRAAMRYPTATAATAAFAGLLVTT